MTAAQRNLYDVLDGVVAATRLTYLTFFTEELDNPPVIVELLEEALALMRTCKHCGREIVDDDYGTWIDQTGGDVCGYNGGNEPHEPIGP